MTITFLDRRDQSTLTFSTAEINNFIQDLQAIFVKIKNFNIRATNNLLSDIKNKNVNDAIIQSIYINIDFIYVTEIVELAESYGIPILLRLSQMYKQDYIEMSTVFTNKKCLKALALGPSAGYQYVTEQFIDSLLTTDIYSLTLYFVTPLVNKFFKLIEKNKLIKLELDNSESDLEADYNLLFHQLLTSWPKTSQLRQLIIRNIDISDIEEEEDEAKYNESNTAHLAALIQNNVNLVEIDLSSNFLTANFLRLLAENLLDLDNNSAQPLKLDLNSNQKLNSVMSTFARCLSANVAISELRLYNAAIDATGAVRLGAALASNTILEKLSLASCPIGRGVQAICQGIIKNPDSALVSLNFSMIQNFDVYDTESLADLIRSNKITELILYNSFKPQLEQAENIKIYLMLLDALAENSSLTKSDLTFSGLDENEEIVAAIKHVFYNRTIPIKFENLENVGNDELFEVEKLVRNNLAISSKTLIQILQEYQK